MITLFTQIWRFNGSHPHQDFRNFNLNFLKPRKNSTGLKKGYCEYIIKTFPISKLFPIESFE